MATGKALVSLSMKAYALYTVSMVIGCVILTTIIYKAHSGSKVLPLISDTWVHPPGSFISRWMIGNAALPFALVNIGLYFIERAASGGHSVDPKIILAIAILATFFLSWLGAICESDEPTCMGNPIIHDFCFAGFFVLFELSMLLTYHNRRQRIGELWFGFGLVVALQAIALNFIILAHRFFLPDESLVAENISLALAVAQWINVTIVMVLTIHCVFTAQGVRNYAVGFVDTSLPRVSATGGKDVSLVWVVSAYKVTVLCGGLYLTTLLLSSAVGFYMGYLPKVDGQVWFISDMWVDIPGNWISRWGGVQGSHIGYLVQIFLFFVIVTNSKSRKKALIISEIALFGLSIVCVCNEKENLALHMSGALAFFGGYDIYILLTLFHNWRRLVKNQDTREKVWILINGASGTGVVISHLWRLSSGRKMIGSLAALFEWTNALLIVCFAFSDVLAHSNCEGYAFGIFQRPDQVKSIHGAYELMSTDSTLQLPSDIKTRNFV